MITSLVLYLCLSEASRYPYHDCKQLIQRTWYGPAAGDGTCDRLKTALANQLSVLNRGVTHFGCRTITNAE
jgi:hypothetical protein